MKLLVRKPQSSGENSMYMAYSTEEEIYNILKNLNARKTAGADGIRACGLRNNAKLLTPVITALINSSLSEAITPELLKLIHFAHSKSAKLSRYKRQFI